MSSNEGPHHNLLLLSDLHLGEQLPQEAREHVQERASFQDQQFFSFLQHYAHHKVRQKPWRLVIAGDLLDFMHLHVPHEDARWYVPSWDQKGAKLKLQHLFQLFPQTFLGMATFLHAGHQLHIITGNHDAELNLPQIQDLFFQHLLDLAQQHGMEELAHDLHNRLYFCPWYYAEEGLIHIEHGHLHDPLCTVESFLQPDTEAPLRSVSHLAVEAQYLCQESFGCVTAHEADQWGAYDIARHIFRQPLQQQTHILKVAAKSVYRLFSLSWQQRPASLSTRDLEVVSARYGLCPQKLEKLHKSHSLPLYARTFDLLQMLYLDRLLLVILTAWLVTKSLRSSASHTTIAGMMTLISFAFVGIYMYLSRRFPVTATAPSLLKAAYSIADHLRVPLTIFGHNHQFEHRDLGDGHHYINLGTWSPTFDEEEHRPQNSGVLSQQQPFLMIQHVDDALQVDFMSWTTEGVTQLQQSTLIPTQPQTIKESANALSPA